MFTLPFLAGTDSLDDIVFEGRNRTYGAFQLRRSYQHHLGSALLLTIAAGSLLLALPGAVHCFWPEAVAVPPILAELPQPKPQLYELQPVKPVLPVALPPAAAATPHAVMKTEVGADAAVKPAIEAVMPTDAGPSDPATTGAENTTGTGSHTGPAINPGLDSAKPATEAPMTPTLAPEVMPDFVGGRAALQRYLQKHLRYPAAALSAQVSGRVYVSFVVQADGSIGEVTVLKGLGYGTEEAAARVVREMPAWTPGLQNHHAVPVRFTLPITFQFE